MVTELGHYNDENKRYNAGSQAFFVQKSPIIWIKPNWKIETWVSVFLLIIKP
jgi:hypothetical protein